MKTIKYTLTALVLVIAVFATYFLTQKVENPCPVVDGVQWNHIGNYCYNPNDEDDFIDDMWGAKVVKPKSANGNPLEVEKIWECEGIVDCKG